MDTNNGGHCSSDWRTPGAAALGHGGRLVRKAMAVGRRCWDFHRQQ